MAGTRQAILKRLYDAFNKKFEYGSDIYSKMLARVKVKLVPEPKNQHDPYAIKVKIYSREMKRWIQIGYVPSKKKHKVKDKPLNRVVGVLLDSGRISSVTLMDVGRFVPDKPRDGQEIIIYYCKVNIIFVAG
jgi:hypothetical protein